MRLPHKRQTAGRSVVACDSNSAGTPGQVFPSCQIILNEQRQQGNAAQRGRDAFGTATRINASLSRRLSAFFESTSRPRPKSGKVRRSDTRPGDVRERAECSEGSDSAPVRNAPCFGVRAAVCDSLSEAECVPAFARESEHGPFVQEVENTMKDGLR